MRTIEMWRLLVRYEELRRVRVRPAVRHREDPAARVLRAGAGGTQQNRVRGLFHLLCMLCGAAQRVGGRLLGTLSVSRISSGNLPPHMLAPPFPVPATSATVKTSTNQEI